MTAGHIETKPSKVTSDVLAVVGEAGAATGSGSATGSGAGFVGSGIVSTDDSCAVDGATSESFGGAGAFDDDPSSSESGLVALLSAFLLGCFAGLTSAGFTAGSATPVTPETGSAATTRSRCSSRALLPSSESSAAG